MCRDMCGCDCDIHKHTDSRTFAAAVDLLRRICAHLFAMADKVLPGRSRLFGAGTLSTVMPVILLIARWEAVLPAALRNMWPIHVLPLSNIPRLARVRRVQG